MPGVPEPGHLLGDAGRQVGLAQLRGEALNDFNVLFAGTVLAALPVFVLLVLFQKQLVRGLTMGAVK